MSMKKAGVADSGAIRLIVYCSKSLFQKQNKTKKEGKSCITWEFTNEEEEEIEMKK